MKNSSRTYSIIMPRIVGSECFYPKESRKLEGNFSHIISSWKNPGMLIDYAVPVVKKLLDKCKVMPAELDAIATMCLSPNKLAYQPEIGGPRLGHPIQKEIDAKNAWVFDMTDSSLSTSIDVVQAYLLNNNKKYGLIIRAENHSELQADHESGFLWPDGVGALLIEVLSNTALVKDDVTITDYTSRFSACTIIQNSNISHLNDIKGLVKFKFQEELMDSLSNEISLMETTRPILYEGWEPLKIKLGYSPEKLFLGPLYPFHMLSSPTDKEYSFFSFNPFRLELVTRKVRLV